MRRPSHHPIDRRKGVCGAAAGWAAILLVIACRAGGDGVRETDCRDGDGDGYWTGTECAAFWGGEFPWRLLWDCDDGRWSVHPGSAEVCNRVDDDCDGSTDEGTECAAPGGPSAAPLPSDGPPSTAPPSGLPAAGFGPAGGG